MTQDKVDMYLMTNQKYLPAEKIVFLKQKLLEADESKFTLISAVELKDPTTLLLVSIFVGGLGIDRFMLGDTGMGVLKLLTGGLCGILTIVDWFTVQNRTRELNFNRLAMVLVTRKRERGGAASSFCLPAGLSQPSPGIPAALRPRGLPSFCHPRRSCRRQRPTGSPTFGRCHLRR